MGGERRRRAPGRPALRWAVLSQLAVVLGLLVCGLLEPWVYLGAAGISRFGTRWPSVVPYTLGLGLGAWFLALAGRDYLPGRTDDVGVLVRRALRVLALLTALAVLSTYPYRVHLVLEALHRTTGTVLVVWQCLMSIALLRLAGARWADHLLLALVLLGAVLMLVALLTPAGFLSTAQLLFVVAFAGLFVRATARLHR